MKLINTIIATTLFSVSFLHAQITICVKENSKSLINIELIKLDGGKCKGLYSLKEMKKSGWIVQDAKITTNDKNMYNIAYVLKQISQNKHLKKTITTNINEDIIEKNIIKKLEKKQLEKKEFERKQVVKNLEDEGKKLYINKCQSCHGNKGEKIAYGTSRAINKLSYEEMKTVINDYISYDEKNPEDNYDRGNAIVMRPYAANTTNYELKQIKTYLDLINK